MKFGTFIILWVLSPFIFAMLVLFFAGLGFYAIIAFPAIILVMVGFFYTPLSIYSAVTATAIFAVHHWRKERTHISARILSGLRKQVRCLAFGIAVNVGVNTTHRFGHCRGPIFDDGRFEFIHIPWDLSEYGIVDPLPKKYKDMPYARYVREDLIEQYVARSPDFENLCFAMSGGSTANSIVHGLKKGDYLFFYATLDFHGNPEKKEVWINPNWGGYILGLFKVHQVWERSDVLIDGRAYEAFQGYDFFRILRRPECFGAHNSEESECQQCRDAPSCSQSQGIFFKPNPKAPWIKGIGEENGTKVSGLIEHAIPLSSPEPGNSQKWSPFARRVFQTPLRKPLGEHATFRSAVRCDGERLDELLEKCVLRNA